MITQPSTHRIRMQRAGGLIFIAASILLIVSLVQFQEDLIRIGLDPYIIRGMWFGVSVIVASRTLYHERSLEAEFWLVLFVLVVTQDQLSWVLSGNNLYLSQVFFYIITVYALFMDEVYSRFRRR